MTGTHKAADTMDLRIGDRVELVGEVMYIGNTVRVNFARPGHPDKDVVDIFRRNVECGKLLPRALKVGDRVMLRCSLREGHIKAIDDGVAWLKWVDGGNHYSAALSELERA